MGTVASLLRMMFCSQGVLLLLVLLPALLCKDNCEEYIAVQPTPGENDELVGNYRLTDEAGCPEGCSYTREGSDDTWCFKAGPYNYHSTCQEATTMPFAKYEETKLRKGCQ